MPVTDRGLFWGCPIEHERRNRIRLLVGAHQYEIDNRPTMSDAEWDALALAVRPTVKTGRPDLDTWFAEHFVPHTGQWVHTFPDLPGLARLAQRLAR